MSANIKVGYEENQWILPNGDGFGTNMEDMGNLLKVQPAGVSGAYYDPGTTFNAEYTGIQLNPYRAAPLATSDNSDRIFVGQLSADVYENEIRDEDGNLTSTVGSVLAAGWYLVTPYQSFTSYRNLNTIYGSWPSGFEWEVIGGPFASKPLALNSIPGVTPPSDVVVANPAPLIVVLTLGGDPPYQPGFYTVAFTLTGDFAPAPNFTTILLNIRVESNGFLSYETTGGSQSVIVGSGGNEFATAETDLSDDLVAKATNNGADELILGSGVMDTTLAGNVVVGILDEGCAVSPSSQPFVASFGNEFSQPYVYFNFYPPQAQNDPGDPLTPAVPPGENPNEGGSVPPPPDDAPGGGTGGGPGGGGGLLPGPIDLVDVTWVSAEPSIIPFGEVCVGSFDVQPVILRNLGNVATPVSPAVVSLGADQFSVTTPPTQPLTFPHPDFELTDSFGNTFIVTVLGKTPTGATIAFADGTTSTIAFTEMSPESAALIQGSNLQPGQSATMRVYFIPTAVGVYSLEATLATNDPEMPITIVGSGTGTDCGDPDNPAIRTIRLDGDAPGSGNLNFLEQNVGTPTEKIVKITNTGNVPVALTMAERFSGDAAFTNATLNTIVDVGETHELVITYAPTEVGADSAIFRAASDATNIDPDGHAYFSTVGQAFPEDQPITRQIRFNGPLEFGGVFIGDSATRTFTISNVGTGSVLLRELSIPLPYGFTTTDPRFQTQTNPDGTTSLVLVDENAILSPLQTTDPITVIFSPFEGGEFNTQVVADVQVTQLPVTHPVTGIGVLDFAPDPPPDGGGPPDPDPGSDPPTAGESALDGVGNACVRKSCTLTFLYKYRA